MTIYDCQLRHGPDGRIVGKVETVNGRAMTWTYAYDREGRLTGAHLDGRTVCDINYDREGRRVSDYFPHLDTHYRNYAYSGMDNRLQQAGNNGYTHDENGFRSIWNSGGKYTLYEYAPDYRLVKAEKRETGEAFKFSHDEEGRREAKFRNGKLVEAYRWLDFLRLDGFHDGQSAYRFAYRDGERTPYAMEREDGAKVSLFYDQVGSLRVVADTGGNVIKEVLYDPFGGIMEDSNPALRIPIGFAGGLHDRDLGFVRFGWRDYDTFTSRWTAPDPLGDEGGDPDWYGYCLDDPVNGVDPMGLHDLRYYDGNGTLEVDGNESTQTFPASNNPAKGFDKFPNGTFPFDYHKVHPESDENGSYGKYGNFVFTVPGHKGMGIHSGRKNGQGFQHPTHGCIRTTDDGHKALWDLFQKGKIDSLEVNPERKRK